MEFKTSQIIPYPIEVVFALVRDRLVDLVPFLPNVNKILVESREDLGEGKVRLANRWFGKGDIPKVAQALVKPDKLAWLDTAVWDEKEGSCTWEITPMFFKEAVTCKGVNSYKKEGDDRTRLEIAGQLVIRAEEVKGVPRLIGRKISGQVEKFVVKLLTPNLTTLADGVTEFLKHKAK